MAKHPYIPSPSTSIPPGIFCAEDYERIAPEFLEQATLAHVAGGSDRGTTAAANRLAFDAWAPWPRLLADVGSGSTAVRLPGHTLPHPIGLGPVAFLGSFHPAAELEVARAAGATGTLLVLSTLSSLSLEDIARAAGPQRWFQLYVQPSRDVTADLIARAAQAGYTALMVTLDTPIQPASYAALRAGYRRPATQLPDNLIRYPEYRPAALRPGASRVFGQAMQAAPTWKDLAALVEESPLPVWVKGVLHPADAKRLVDLGVTGMVVSNHGGRSLDGVPASLAALPHIRRALPRPYPLLLDGGIRRGSDVFKALALGADAVLVGRLQAYAMAAAGALGVAHMIKLLREELETCMALAGCPTIDSISADSIVAVSERGAVMLPDGQASC